MKSEDLTLGTHAYLFARLSSYFAKFFGHFLTIFDNLLFLLFHTE